MNSLTERVQQAWSILLGKQQVEQPKTQGVADASQLGSLKREWDEAFGISSDRSARMTDFTKMDSGRMASMLDYVVLTATSFEETNSLSDDILLQNDVFKIQCEGYRTSEPKQIIRRVIDDTQLRRKVRPILRDVLRAGDAFIELLFDDNSNLTRLFSHDAKNMRVNLDDKGDLDRSLDDNGRPQSYQQITDIGTVVAGWAPWELLHIKYWPVDGMPYSRMGFLDAYRQTWNRLNWLEQSLVVGRISRAYLRYLWRVDVTGKSAEEAKKIMKGFALAITKRETPSGMYQKTPLQPDEDIFYGTGYRTGNDGKLYESLTGATPVDPNNTGLGKIDDIEYFLTALHDKVPGDMLGIHKQQGVELTGQEVSFGHLLSYIGREILEAQLIRPIIDASLAVRGYHNIPYRVILPRPASAPSWKMADAQFRLGLGARTWKDMDGASARFFLKRIYNLSDDEVDEIFNQVEDEKKRFGPLKPGDATALIAKGNQSAGMESGDPVVEAARELLDLTK